MHGTVSHADNDREDTHGGSRWSLSGFTRNVGCEGLIYAYDGGNSDSEREIDVRQKNSLHQPIIVDNLASSPRHISLLYHTSSPNTTYTARKVVRHTLYTTMVTLTSDQLSTIVSPHFDPYLPRVLVCMDPTVRGNTPLSPLSCPAHSSPLVTRCHQKSPIGCCRRCRSARLALTLRLGICL